MPIKVLSDLLASQIAAGEVVERPASVVKELVENALDANATTIHVDIRDGGHTLIQIADDGEGIVAQDVEIAFRRHATSKIQSVADLSTIGTLGFRGEALAAISSVSQVTVVSRPTEQSAGIRLVIHGGDLISRDQVGAPKGTVIAVENIFYNVPARLQFLKGQASEKRVIDELITCYALAYPNVRFRLSHNGHITFQSAGNDSVLDVLVAVYGAETARQLLELRTSVASSEEDSDSPKKSIEVTGYVSPPHLHRANRGQIILFVNGRWVKDAQLTYAMIQAYHTLLPVGRFPMGILFITLPLTEVDVNVHPTKAEVRFRHPNAAFSVVQRTVRQTITNATLIRGFTQLTAPPTPDWGGNLDQPDFAPPIATKTFDYQSDFDFAPTIDSPASASHLPNEPFAEDTDPQLSFFAGKKLPMMRVVGQVGAAYIITEGPEGMFLIDQHAAHERILYERFMAEWGQDGIASQGLIAGISVHLTPAQTSLLEENLPLLHQLGFVIDAFGPHTWMMRSVPALLSQQDPTQALLTIVEDLEHGHKPMQDTIEARIIKRVCKTAAVKAGQTLSVTEMQRMIEQLENCHNPHTCPHGRPTLIHLSIMQLAREFGRT